MKFCSKCGNQIHDEAVICVHCGCSIESKPNKTDSNEYSKLIAFVNEAKTIRTLGIISIVLCLGIGIIFQIINLVKIKKYLQNKAFVFPELNLSDPADIRLYEEAKKKIESGNNLTTLGFSITIAVIGIGIAIGSLAPLL